MLAADHSAYIPFRDEGGGKPLVLHVTDIEN